MALKITKDTTFKATVTFLQDGSAKEVTFRLPRPKDFYTSRDGNTSHESMMTICNMALPFEEAVMVTDEAGQAVPITSLKALYELDITFTIDDVVAKWKKANEDAAKAKEALVKKSKSAGNSTQKVIQDSPLAD